MRDQCVFCFCELKSQNYNSEICTECLANPLEIDAIQQLRVYSQCTNCDKFLCSFHLEHKFIDVELCPRCYYIQNSNYSFYDPEDDFDDSMNFTETQIYRSYENQGADADDEEDDRDGAEDEGVESEGEDGYDNREAEEDDDEDEEVDDRYNVTFFNQMNRYFEGQQQQERESDGDEMDLSEEANSEHAAQVCSRGRVNGTVVT
jgi:hypothetical protein